MNRVCLTGYLVCLALSLSACERAIESPTPTATALDPALACGEQLTTAVRVDGEHLSPLPFDVLTDNPDLALPDLWIQRSVDLAGSPVDDALVDLDESEAAGRVRWLSQREMSFDVFPELELTPGLYHFFAKNADGQIAELPGAITIVPRPTLDSIVPDIVCAEQITNRFVVTGSMFILVDGLQPTVTIGDENLAPTDVEGCVDLPGPAGAQACTTLRVTLPPDTLPPSIVDVTVTNPEPAGCESTDSVQVELVPPPSVAAIEPPLACVEQSDRVFIVSGTDFLVLEQGGDDVYPTVSVGGVEMTPDDVDGCSNLLGPAPGRRCTDLTITLPQASLDPGLQAVYVTNPETAQCVSEEEVDLEVVPPPTLTSIEPALVCSEQLENVLTLTGTDFIVVPDDDGDLLPEVSFGDALTLTVDSASNCEDLPGTLGAESCETLTVTLAVDALAPAIYDITVTNPPPAGCTSTQPVRFEVIPPPTLQAIEPALTCLAQGARGYELTGTNFLVLEVDSADVFPDVAAGTAVATVSAAGTCTDLEGPVAGRLCTSLTISLAEDALDPGLHDVLVTNPSPAACETQETIQLEVIARPTLASVEPILACVEGADRAFAITGTGLLVLDGEGEAPDIYPTVTVGIASVTATADNADCQALSGTVAGRLCTGLTFTLPAGSLEAGFHDLFVTNPMPGGCTSLENDVELEVVPPATVSAITPQLVCGSQFSNSFTITGSGFLVFADDGGDLLPSVRMGDYEAVVDSVDQCSDRTDSPFGGRECLELAFTLPADGTAAGVHTAVVINPAPADCASTDPVEVEVLGEPIVESLIPAGLCSAYEDTVVRITGTGFLSLGATTADWPTVQFGTQSYDTAGLDGCEDLTGPVTGQICTAVDVFIPNTVFTQWNESVVVTNPPLAACASEAAGAPGLDEVPPPTISAFEPDPVCDDAVTFAILGIDFQEGATVAIADSVTHVNVAIDSITIDIGETDDRIDVVTSFELDAGLYDVTVTNPDRCFDAETAFLEVVTGPFLFNVDPPVVYREIRTQITLYVAGVTDEITDVWIVEDETDVRTDLEFTFNSTDSENLVFAEIPAGTLPEGWYTVFIDDFSGCPDYLEGVLYVEADKTVAVGNIEPPFGWTLENTAVDIFTKDPVPTGEVLFQDVPRVYLNPTADDSAVATLLRSVTYQDETRLTAVVPADRLPPGAYEVVVINPDGSIGVADEPFVVTDIDSPPPRLDNVIPARIPAGKDWPLELFGDHFRDDAVVTFDCLAPGETESDPVSAPLDDYFAITDEVISVTMPAAGPPSLVEGTVCVVQVVQTATAGEGLVIDTLVELSAVSVISNSGNLFFIGDGPPLDVPRQSPAAARGRATNVDRFIYAIGGDDPAPAAGGPTVFSSIEVASIDRFGNLDEFNPLDDPIRLVTLEGGDDFSFTPEPRSRAGVAQIGRFIYLAGGINGAGAVDTVLRAQVLDPLSAPVPETVNLELLGPNECVDGAVCGIGPGTWIYRIAALFDPTDLVNPGGESLVSDPFVIRVPDLNPDDDDLTEPNSQNRVILTVSWDPVDRAVGYRVYRSRSAGAASGTEEFLVDVVDTSVTDAGLVVADDPEHVSLGLGALGEWAVVAQLPLLLGEEAAAAARDAPCVTWGLDPDDLTQAYIYVAGGLDGTGARRDTISVVPISLESEDVQVVGTPFSSFNTLDVARDECGGFRVGNWMYFGSGRVSTTTATSDNDFGYIVGSDVCDEIFESCTLDVEALCSADLATCEAACGDDACREGCMDAYDVCYNVGTVPCDDDLVACDLAFPAGELICQEDLTGLTEACLINDSKRAVAGYGPASTGDFLFMFGGASRDDNLFNQVFEAEMGELPDFSNYTPSGSVTFDQPRRFSGIVQESGFIFIIGGEVETDTGVETTATTRFTL